MQGSYCFPGSVTLQHVKTKSGWPLEDNSCLNTDPDTFLVLTGPNYLRVSFPSLWLPSVVGSLTATPWQHSPVAAHWNSLGWGRSGWTNRLVWDSGQRNRGLKGSSVAPSASMTRGQWCQGALLLFEPTRFPVREKIIPPLARHLHAHIWKLKAWRLQPLLVTGLMVSCFPLDYSGWGGGLRRLWYCWKFSKEQKL